MNPNSASAVDRAPQTSAVAHFWKPKAGYIPDLSKAPVLDDSGCPIGYEHAFDRDFKNTVTTAGKNYLLDTFFAGSAYTAAWYAGLISSVSYSAISAADTIASHAGWTEAGTTNAPDFTGTRPAITFAAASAGVKASSSIPTVTFTSAGTVKGLFTVSQSTVMGTTGTMYSAGLFTSGDAVVGNGYVMTLTFSATQT